MSTYVKTRNVHFWLSMIISIPFLIVLLTGVLLQVRKQVPWIQPPSQKGQSQIPVLSMDSILRVVQKVPSAHVEGWGQITRLDVRPSKGIVKVQTRAGVEVQVDMADGKVLQVAERNSDFIEALHEGTWFFDSANYWIFLPSSILMIGLLFSGFYLIYKGIVVRLKKRKVRP
jgi:uncharacterized iron-regulated membrane protein